MKKPMPMPMPKKAMDMDMDAKKGGKMRDMDHPAAKAAMKRMMGDKKK